MNIYTSYFAQIRNFPEDFTPVAICGGIPDWYKGIWTKQVAPKWGFFNEWKKNHDNNFYIEHFNNEVLANLTADDFIRNLIAMTNNASNIVLLCYEKPTDFCHRHLVADWINKNNTIGIEVKEWTKNGTYRKAEAGTGYCNPTV